MSRCVIGHITVRDARRWDDYRARVPATLAPFGGELVLRGRTAGVLNGHWSHTDTVVLRFPDAAAVAGWYGSPAYRALVPLRDAAADVVLVEYDADEA